MIRFTGWEYLLIDAANAYGLDKANFEARIQWATENLDTLEAFAEEIGPKERPLFIKACMAIRKAQKGQPTGHLVGFDAVCSGLQIMSAITGCAKGAFITGMIDPENRMDAYTEITGGVNKLLKAMGLQVNIPRADAKMAVMTSLYGSKKTPKDVFGEDSPELEAFYQAMTIEAPGAWELLQDLLASWQPFALTHEWKLPDGYDVRNVVRQQVQESLEVDELDHARITYIYNVNQGMKKYVSNAANVVHSLDAYLLRSLIRRCNYDAEITSEAQIVIAAELLARHMGESVEPVIDELVDYDQFLYYLQQYERSKMVDVIILPYLNEDTVRALDDDHLRKLSRIVNQMLEHKPFEIISVHDDFKAHPNNVNWVRHWYKEIMADLAESDVMSDIHTQITGQPCHFPGRDPHLSEKIRNSNYALS